MTAPAETLRAAVRLLRNPYNCLPGKDILADLLDTIADDMAEAGAVEGSASVGIHPMTVLGLGEPNRVWAAALSVALAQPGIETELTGLVNGTTGPTDTTTGDPS